MNACVDLAGLELSGYNTPSSLIYGIGNTGRQDDGLGWAFIDWLESRSLCPQAEIIRHYQLHLEDADLISRKDRVLFVDATKETDVDSFCLRKPESEMDFSFTSHAISVPAIMATCEHCFGRVPEVYLLVIRGYEWDLRHGLSAAAQQNLEAATTFAGATM